MKHGEGLLFSIAGRMDRTIIGYAQCELLTP